MDHQLTMGKIRITSIIGTRPEAIKLVPVILAARKRPDQFQVSVVRTGQHRGLVDQLMDEFGVYADDDLRVMQSKQDLNYVLTECLRGLSELFARRRPDWVLVQGDTMSTVAGALAGFYHHINVGHVEAGLRTGDRRSPFPEEVNRSIATRLADLHFAPTEQARRNLLLESIADEDIVVTGNTVVDALVETLSRSPSRPIAGRCRYIVFTAHRRENLGGVLHDICDGLIILLERNRDVRAIVPMHPNPSVRDVLIRRFGGHDRIVLREALGYTEFLNTLNGASLVLTDSGGVQEECAVLEKPMLILREHTERPEALDGGRAILVGTNSHRIADVGSFLLGESKACRAAPSLSTKFGDGTASTRILDAVLSRTRA